MLQKYILLSIIIIFSAAAFGQGSVQVLVKGIVTDKYTSAPLGIEFDIKPANGNKFKGKSNTMDGKFELLLNAGETYVITPQGNDILREEITLTVKEAASFTEQKFDFKASKLKAGTVLYTQSLFSGSAISESGKKFLEEFKSVMRFNRYVSFELAVGGNDSQRLEALKAYTADWKAFQKRLSITHGGQGQDLTVRVSSVEEAKTN